MMRSPGPIRFSKHFRSSKQVTPVTANGIQRFSVTQLINYQRCPRQFYFDRVLQLPTADELAVWNNAEAPEPPANLTATLKGAVIHRFCERFTPDQNVEECLRSSFEEVVRLRQANLADRLVEIDSEAATKDCCHSRRIISQRCVQRVEARAESRKHRCIRQVKRVCGVNLVFVYDDRWEF